MDIDCMLLSSFITGYGDDDGRGKWEDGGHWWGEVRKDRC